MERDLSCYNEAKEKHGIKFVRCRVHSLFSQEGEVRGQVINYVDESAVLWSVSFST